MNSTTKFIQKDKIKNIFPYPKIRKIRTYDFLYIFFSVLYKVY